MRHIVANTRKIKRNPYMNTTKGSNRPNRPVCRLDERVNDRIEALLARVAGIRRGSEIARPHVFDRDGERHANQVAARDRKETN